jgi:Rrf2 family protein
MKFSATARHAVRALVHLAALGAGALAAAHDIARAHGLPEVYLARALTLLARAGLVRSVRGLSGGYRLARPAKSITLLEVVEAVDGPVRGVAPAVEGAAGVNRRLAEACDVAAGTLRMELQRVRLSDLVG